MSIRVQVVYALPDCQTVIDVDCPRMTTVREAIRLSRICSRHVEIDLKKNEVGVYGCKQSLDYVLKDQERVEIYRSLTLSPTEARRLRAKSRQRAKNIKKT